jgi:hypothetical protein
MSDTLEKVARVLAAGVYATCRSGEEIESVDDLHGAQLDIGRVDLIEVARSVIESMRDPDREMLAAGIAAIEDKHESTLDSEGSYLISNASDYALPGWQAMIDAVLAGEDQE